MCRSDRIIIRYFLRFRNRFFPESNFSGLYCRTFYQVFRIFVKSRNLKNQGIFQNDLIIFQLYWHGISENFLKFQNLFANFLARNNIVLHRESATGMSKHDGQFWRKCVFSFFVLMIAAILFIHSCSSFMTFTSIISIPESSMLLGRRSMPSACFKIV